MKKSKYEFNPKTHNYITGEAEEVSGSILSGTSTYPNVDRWYQGYLNGPEFSKIQRKISCFITRVLLRFQPTRVTPEVSLYNVSTNFTRMNVYRRDLSIVTETQGSQIRIIAYSPNAFAQNAIKSSDYRLKYTYTHVNFSLLKFLYISVKNALLELEANRL